MNIWQELGIAPTGDLRAIKRAYAARLKQVHPEDDAEGFQRLRAAYEHALRLAEQGAEQDAREQAAGEPPAPPVAEVILEMPVNLAKPIPADDRLRPVAPLPPPVAAMARPPAPLEVARTLCAELMQTYAQQRVPQLRHRLQHPDWQLLDFQTAIEQAALDVLTQRFDDYMELIPVFAEVYRWGDPGEVVQRTDPRLYELWHRRQARRWRLEVEEDRRHSSLTRRKALALLLGAPDEKPFRRFARWSEQLKAMQQLLEDLEQSQRAALHFEINRESADWWRERIGQHRLTFDQAGLLVLAGLLLGALPLLALTNFLLTEWQLDLFRYPAVGIACMLAACSPPLLGNAALRWWKRKIHQGVFRSPQEIRRLWTTEPRRRSVLVSVAIFSGAMSLMAPLSPWFLLCSLTGFAWLAFHYSLGYATVVMGIYAWPLAGLIAFGTFLAAQLTGLQGLPVGARQLLFAHLLASYLFHPLTQLLVRAKLRLTRSGFENPLNVAFGITFFAGLALLLSWRILEFREANVEEARTVPITIDYGKPKPPAPPAPAEASQPPTELFRLPTAPTPAPTAQRPLSDVRTRASALQDAIAGAYRKHYSLVSPPPDGAQMTLHFTVMTDGSVGDVQVTDSGFTSRDFERDAIAAVSGFRYSAKQAYAPSRFSYRFDSDLERPSRPEKEVATLAPLINGTLREAERSAFGEAAVPAGARITLRFRVEPDGRVSRVTVVSSSFGRTEFDRLAREGLQRLRFPSVPGYRATDFFQEYGDSPRPAGSLAPGAPPAAASGQERPQSSLRDSLPQLRTRFNLIALDYYQDRQPPAFARMIIRYTVMPDGAVGEARLEYSGFDNPEFEQRLLADIKSFRFAADERYRPTTFTERYSLRPPGTPPEAPATP
ncbi:J domain-containing protein [Solimonas sp. K1W22B-7]|uniref:TonB family protein n=1 Tax=Solimonas sp. K1W22B-7 TaxID=2303331 RepID=UPI000E334EBC|nr:TonB family protein [Solimonas sp. K1W22B-7]AXQ31166.1 J domain-containing protein [Solimonas sp. K1W22B-7]